MANSSLIWQLLHSSRAALLPNLAGGGSLTWQYGDGMPDGVPVSTNASIESGKKRYGIEVRKATNGSVDANAGPRDE
eukprot:2148415-Prymnesium_polylepis.1